MISVFIGGLLTAWVLSWFGFDELIMSFSNDTFKYKLTSSQYYVGFATLTVVSSFFMNKL